MFKRAVISDEISQNIDRAVEVATRFGLEGIEIRSIWGKNPHELDKSEIRKIFDIVKAADMMIPCLATPIFKCNINDDEEYKHHIEILEKSIRAAIELETSMVRGFTFWKTGKFKNMLPEILEKINSIIPLLEEHNITMIIESDPNTNANSSQKLEKILSRLNSKWIKALWDPGNNLYLEEAERPFPEGYRRLKNYIAHIHVKDVLRNTNSNSVESCCVGKGEVGFDKIFEKLIADKYTGWISLETHYRLHKIISKDLLDSPKGYVFSIGGEESSIESLRSWNKMLQKKGFL